MTQKEINNLAFDVVACAIEVHRVLGPGLLESIYEDCFCQELAIRQLSFIRQTRIPVIY